MVNGIECDGQSQKGKSSDRPFGHIENNIILNIKEGTFGRVVFSKMLPSKIQMEGTDPDTAYC